MKDRLPTLLRELRKAKSASLRDVEKATSISNAYLSQLERGEASKPSADKLYSLADYYGVPYQNLLAAAGYIEEGEKTNSSSSPLANALMAVNVTDKEKDMLMAYLNFIRSSQDA